MKFRPLHDRVVVERIDAEAKSAGGIIIPDTAQEKPSQGKVVAVGPGGRDEAGKLIPIDIKVGDRVLFGKWSGTEVKIDGKELLIMKESDIMGISRRDRGSEEGRLITNTLLVLGRAYRARLRRTRLTTRSESNVCQGSQIRCRRARQDVARRRDSRQRRQGDARPEGPQCRPRQVVWSASHHQGRRHRRQGDRARRQVREHGRTDGARSRLEVLGLRR